MQGHSRRLHDTVVNFVSNHADPSRLVVVVTLPTHRGVFTFLSVNRKENVISEFALCRSVTGPTVSSVGLVTEDEFAVVEATMRFVASALWSTIKV